MGLGQKLTKEIIEEGAHLTSLVGKEATVTAQNIPTKFLKQSTKAAVSSADDAATIALKSENEAVAVLGQMKDEAIAMAPEYKATDAALRYQAETRNQFLKSKSDYGAGFKNSELDEAYNLDYKPTPKQGAYNQEWKDLQAYKAKNISDPLSEKLSGATETFESTAAAEQLTADTAATMASINEGRFFTSGLEKTQSVLDMQADFSRPITSTFTNPLSGLRSPIAATEESVKAATTNVPKSRIKSNADLSSSGLNDLKSGSQEYQKALKEKLRNKYGNYVDPEKHRLNQWLKNNQSVPEPPINEDTAWGSTAKAALGTAVAGGALMAALSSSRGQQNNAQLYGQQPLY